MDDAIRTTDDDFTEALDHMRAGEYALALPILARLVAFEPSDTAIFEAWIDAHVRLERYQRATEIADAGIAEGRSRAACEMWKAVIFNKEGKLEQAEAAARAAIADEPSYAPAIEYLSSLLEKQNRYEEALELCRRAADENPDEEDLAVHVVALADAMELHDLVIERARHYLRRFGKHAAVLSFLGNAYLDRKEYRRAERAFRDAAAMEPGVEDHHFNIVMMAMMRGDHASADAYLDKLAERDVDLADRVGAAVDDLLARVEKDDSQV